MGVLLLTHMNIETFIRVIGILFEPTAYDSYTHMHAHLSPSKHEDPIAKQNKENGERGI